MKDWVKVTERAFKIKMHFKINLMFVTIHDKDKVCIGKLGRAKRAGAVRNDLHGEWSEAVS
jgi:hypothetical protein